MFLAETWADEARLKEIKRNINFENLFFVDRNNRGGGLAMYWRNSIDVNVESFSKNHIDAIVNKGKEEAWRFTGFYGEPVTHRRFESWDMLRQLNNRFHLPWLCAGDFNEIVSNNEKLGGSNRSHSQMQLFRDVLDECGFIDLGYVGSPFTWQKHFADGHSIRERLDRGMANNEWFLKFAGTKIHHLSSNNSDHCPLWIIPDGLEVPQVTKPFRFEEMWLVDRGCTEIVEAVWAVPDEAEPAVKVIKKIKKCGKELHAWNRTHFGNVRSELKKKRKQLIEAEKEAMRTGRNFRIQELKKEICDLEDKENRLWFQRSKALWAQMEIKIQSFFIAVPLKG